MSRPITSLFGAAFWGGGVAALVVAGMVIAQEDRTKGQRPRTGAPQVQQKAQMRPMVREMSPASAGVGVGIAAKVAATFNEDMDRTTINTNTFTLSDSSGLVAATVTYNAANNTATLDTNAPLAYSTTYTATIRGDVKDTSGNAMGTDFTWSFATGADLTSGPGGPILVVTSPDNPFSSYYAEILRSEGLNEFETAEISKVSAGTVSLTNYDVVILGQMSLTPAQVTMFSDWVNAGGRLIAMRPDKQLAGLLGLTDASSTPLSDKYLLVNTASGPGLGITDQTIQYHGEADLYTLDGAWSLAILYSDATTATATPNPAVTLRNVGPNGGQAAAFTYDLARSIVYTRQGNPAWDGQKRDCAPPPLVIRSDDLYYPDYVNLAIVSIPQADEQQRFLANLITQMDLTKKPLPRFWYFPNGAKAIVLQTGDDHAIGNTVAQFDTFLADGTSSGQPIRASSYIYPNTPLRDDRAASYTAYGFEVGLHPASVDSNGNVIDWTPSQLDSYFTKQLSDWQEKFPSLPTPSTNRTHAIVWSTYSDQPQIELNHRIRLDTNYYYYPYCWIEDPETKRDRPGLFTGSGMPMRFATKDGKMIDVYQATTQMTDESGQDYPKDVGALLNAATGPQGYYGVFTVNAHTDYSPSDVRSIANNIIGAAQLYNVPVVSGRQLLGWLDYRNNSSFGSLAWNATAKTLSFTITTADNASGLQQANLQAMVPLLSDSNAEVAGITWNGSAVTYTTQRIKGTDYALFPAVAGSYAVQYAPDTQPPAVVSQSPAPNATGVYLTTAVTATFNDAMNPATISTSSVTLTPTNSSGQKVDATVTYDTASKTAMLTPTSGLASNTKHTATISGARDVADNAMSPVTWSFTTGSAVPPTSIWNSPTALPDMSPAPTKAPDPSAVELGVKFRSSIDGNITGIRFFKDTFNTGPHVGNLWRSDGTRLASAPFTNETAWGWQQVNFASPVAIQPNTTYVASYFAPNGNYAATTWYFSKKGMNSWPLQALADTQDDHNGVFADGPGFPTTDSSQAINYWVDVVFTSGGGPDTMPPTVTGQSPAPNATGVATNTTVTATFSEPMNSASISNSTFFLTSSSGPVAVAVTFNNTTNTATLTPTSPLAASTTYTVTVCGAKDLAGNTMAAPMTWPFTTGSAVPPTSIWSPSATPAVANAPDPEAVELGVKFRSDVAGYVIGIRFYKGSTNTGPHVGNLWRSDGTRLASAPFTNETAWGWQQVNFASPVAIQPNTTYVASYFAPNGNYSFNQGYFATSGVDNAPLHALADGADGGNGVFVYGPGGVFPTGTFNASNYWVDVVFSPSSGTVTPAAPMTAGPNVTGVWPHDGATDVNPRTNKVIIFFGSEMDPATINEDTIQLHGRGISPGGRIPYRVTYGGETQSVTIETIGLLPSTHYTVTVTGGAKGVKSRRGKVLSGKAPSVDHTISFTTGQARR